MPRLFSYVVEHDYGLSPNPDGGFCTLAFCKYNTAGKRNVVELAEVGDWIAGAGGSGPKSAGHGRLVYAMRVTEKLVLRDYFRDLRFTHRAGNVTEFAGRTDMFALVSEHFFYFGSAAPKLARRHRDRPIEKRGPGHRSRFDERFVTDFVAWLEGEYRVGVHGRPCAEHPDATEPDPSWQALRKRPCRRRPRC